MEVFVQAQDLWNFYLAHQMDEFGEYKLANNFDNGISVWLEDGSVIVRMEGEEVFRDTIEDEVQCYTLISAIYETYLEFKASDAIVDEIDGEVFQTPLTRLEEIEDREEELNLAVSDFWETVTDDPIDDKTIEVFKDHILEYMARELRVKVYRPMYLEDDNGRFFEEFPYGHIIDVS